MGRKGGMGGRAGKAGRAGWSGRDGTIQLAWRDVYPGNIRDIAFAVSRDDGRVDLGTIDQLDDSRRAAVASETMMIVIRVAAGLILGFVLLTGVASAQTISGTVRDETGGALPGVTVEARSASGSPSTTATDASGRYQFDRLADGRYQLTFTLINFASLT